MSNLKAFSRSVRQEINRISMSLKQMEFRILRMRGFLKRKLREEIMELRRMKDAIMHRLSELTAEARLNLPTVQSIRDDIALLHERCRQLKTQHL
jgi:hypothetical protein